VNPVGWDKRSTAYSVNMVVDMMKFVSQWLKCLLSNFGPMRPRNGKTCLKMCGFGACGLVLVALVSLRVARAVVSSQAQSPVADTIFIGEFVTLDRSHPKAEAMAVFAGRIIAIGSRSEVEALATKNTRKIRINGVALPGFADAHVHVAGVGEQLERMDLRGLTNAEILA
jgi:hypothetical protein